VAFGNRSKGFDHNNGNAGQTMVNCTSYSNGGANFSFYETPSKGTRLYNLLVNCVSFSGTLTNLAANTVQFSNSWQIASVTAADFLSLDVSVATNARNADFSLPTNNLFRLAPGSDLIDRGRNVGLPFSGSAPDLGAFEYSSATSTPVITLTNAAVTNGQFQFRIQGLTGAGQIVIHASTNLLHWQPVFTNPPASGELTFTDPQPVAVIGRFYRAVQN
jgi:hypothetical protein